MASQPQQQQHHPLSRPVSIKLDDENFLTWQQQAIGALKSTKLFKIINEENQGGKPKQFLTDADKENGKNSDDFENWEQQDQTVLTWLLALMSPSLHTRMVQCNHAFQIWKNLQVFFASQTRAKISQLKTQLRAIKKTGKLNEYFQSIQKVVDTLAAIGSKIDDQEQLQVILDGLPSEYNSIVASVLSRIDPYTIADIEALLMAMEARMERTDDIVQDLQANYANFRGGRNGNHGNYRGGRSNFSNFRGSRGRGRSFSRGGAIYGRNGNGLNSRPQCQVCDKLGHTAIDCWYRFDDQYQGTANHNKNTTSSNEAALQDSSISALMAVPDTVFDPSWYPDSGSTNHITPDQTNLQSKHSYNGDQKIKMANGQQGNYSCRQD